MKKLFANYNFEQRLANKKLQDQGRSFSKDLEFFFFFLSSPDEKLIPQKSYSAEYCDYLSKYWGIDLDEKIFSHNACEFAKNWWEGDLSLELERYLNSKKSSFKFSKKFGYDSDFPSFCIESEQEWKNRKEEVLSLILKTEYENWVVKDFFGYSGKWKKIIKKESFLNSSLDFHQGRIIEPWVQRVNDFGLKIISREQVSSYRLLNHSKGGFLGVYINESIKEQEQNFIETFYPNIYDHLQAFFGDHFPFQIDGYTYLNEQNSLRKRVLCEINHRKTMVDLFWWLRDKLAIQDFFHSALILIPRSKRDFQIKDILNLNTQEYFIYPLSDNNTRADFFFVHAKSTRGFLDGVSSLYGHLSRQPPKCFSFLEKGKFSYF